MARAWLTTVMLTAALVTAGATARAADYSPPPPPVIIQQPVVQEFASGWYLRGDIGITNQSVRDVTNIQDVNNSVQNQGIGFDASPLFGLGVGYYFNDWLRFDLTGEYRSKANFHGTQVISSSGGSQIITDEYSASKSEWLFLANAYVDLGTWSGFTPFIGAGAGASRNTIHSFRDVCSVCPGTGAPTFPGVAFANDASKWSFAWALHAGVAYKVTKNFIVELAYRYVDLGDAESGDLFTYLGTNNVVNPMQFKHLTSHDIKLGLRFNLDDSIDFARPRPVYAVPAPVYTQPAPVYQQPAPQVYQPPPVYQQPAPVYAPPPQPMYSPPVRYRG